MKNLLVSFSGGETSAYMAIWLKNKSINHGFDNVVYVFANTGLENDETLHFIKMCSDNFKIKTHWVEAKISLTEGAGTRHSIVDFYSCTRNTDWKKRDDTPFEMMIRKYGIPNQAAPHCTRELKQNPIMSFAKEYFNGEPYHTAIGIRIDEVDRMNEKARSKRLIYPLIHSDMMPMTKQKINFWWKSQDFRLNLKGYQGNCITCWKKSNPKLYTIAKEDENYFEFMSAMEKKYPRVGAEFKKDPTATNRVFFRGNRSAIDIINEARMFNDKIRDDSIDFNIQQDLFDSESCDVFSSCGD